MSLGLAELTSASVPGVLAGTAMLGLAAFAPFVLLSLIPIAIDAGHLSQHRRQALSVSSAARDVAGARTVLWQLRRADHMIAPRPRVLSLGTPPQVPPRATATARPATADAVTAGMNDDRHRDDLRDRVDFGTPRGGTALGGLHWRQLGLFVAAAVWALLWTRATSGAAGAVVGALGAVGLASAGVARTGGRLPVDWGAVGMAFTVRRIRGRARYRHRRSATGPRLPAHLADIRILAVATDRGSIGLVRDGARLVAILEVTPEPMMLAGSAEMAGRRAAWGATLAGLARPGSGVARVQWVARTAAVGPRARSRHVDPSLRDRLPDPAVQSYLEVVDRVGDTAHDYVLFIALGVDARRRPSALAAQAALDAAFELSAQLAAADLGAARALSPGEVNAALRAGGDPAAADGFPDTPPDGGAALLDPQDPGPMACEEGWAALRCDATWHASFWISQWPRGEVDAEVLGALVLAGRPGRTVTAGDGAARPGPGRPGRRTLTGAPRRRRGASRARGVCRHGPAAAPAGGDLRPGARARRRSRGIPVRRLRHRLGGDARGPRGRLPRAGRRRAARPMRGPATLG